MMYSFVLLVTLKFVDFCVSRRKDSEKIFLSNLHSSHFLIDTCDVARCPSLSCNDQARSVLQPRSHGFCMLLPPSTARGIENLVRTSCCSVFCPECWLVPPTVSVRMCSEDTRHKMSSHGSYVWEAMGNLLQYILQQPTPRLRDRTGSLWGPLDFFQGPHTARILRIFTIFIDEQLRY